MIKINGGKKMKTFSNLKNDWDLERVVETTAHHVEKRLGNVHG